MRNKGQKHTHTLICKKRFKKLKMILRNDITIIRVTIKIRHQKLQIIRKKVGEIVTDITDVEVNGSQGTGGINF